MSFLSPISLLFGLTIPVVIVFYLLKRKRVVKLVSSTLLWQKFISETQASAPFQKLRRNWLLILQIILLILAVLALSRPYFATRAKSSQLRVLILDASASMQATDEFPSRFERAKKDALQWVDSLRDEDKMVVLQVAASTEVKLSETSEKSALRNAIENCQPMDSPTRLVPALKMAESLVRDRGKDSNPEIHLFSDGAVPDLKEFENKALPLFYHPVGQGANNLGITALDVRANPEDATQRAIYVSVMNFSTNKMETELELSLDGKLVNARHISVGAGETSAQVFLASQTQDGVFTVHLTAQDDLAADNTASIVSLLPHPVKVLLVTRGNRFLERALRSAPNVELATAQDLGNDGSSYDFIVLDNVIPTVWPVGNVLAFHVMQTNWFDKVTQVDSPALVDWRATHPLLRYVSFDNVPIGKSFAVKTPSWGVSLLDSPQDSLMVAGDLGRQRIVWVGFDSLESYWPYRFSFPIFIQNAVDWLNPANAKNSQLLVHAGDAFRLGLSEPETSAQVTLPDGTVKKLTIETNANEVVFGNTFKQGIYRMRVGTNDTTFCVNLLDPAESNIKPRTELVLGQYTKVAGTTLQRTNMELWRSIAAVALLVLMFEWWYYHRRTV
ncbi:MAG TPA: BatA and WFA domain-containing protein [Verrucomicrobiae bacterium]|nr:BatA and WFA domain-containing protein [Verrucomicrobiae bacterium]